MPTPQARPRLWPLVPILAWLAVTSALAVTPQIPNAQRFFLLMGGPALALLAFLVWLLAASRLCWGERLGILLGLVALGAIALAAWHPSMGLTMSVYGVPVAILMVAIGLRVARERTARVRTGLALGLVALGFVPFGLLRLEGYDGSYRPELASRWSPTAEERLVTDQPSGTVYSHPPEVAVALDDWSGFRGPMRDGLALGPALSSDWETDPPQELWRVPVGPGWSSFSSAGPFLFTQEQRGEEEAVVAYWGDTGIEHWRKSWTARFTELVSGAGPRATPTLADGRVFALGATGVLLALDAGTGREEWRHDLMAEFGAPLPVWGFSCSPLVRAGVVMVYVDGTDERGLVAFDVETGEPRWHVATRGMNYGSVQPARLHGVELVLFCGNEGLYALDPATGEEHFAFTPSGWKAAPMIQPQVVGEGSIVLALGDGVGLARLDVERSEDGAWTVSERWSSPRLRPAFNDFVILGGHLYGFDQSRFGCIDLETGASAWRGGRYGFGQVLGHAETNALFVISEEGELVVLAADPEQHRELAVWPALAGKTWNHPVLIGSRLVARNGEEAVSLQLSLASGAR